MKNKLAVILLVSPFILGGLASTVVEAVDVNSKADVQFKANDDGSGKPHDPEKEEPEEVDPDPEIQPPVVYPKGALRLLHVPSLSFGINKIKADGDVIDVLLENVKNIETGALTPRASFVELTDETGLLKGWTLTVKSDGVFRSADKGNIDGTITFSEPAIRGINGMEVNPDVAPTGSGFSIGKDHPGSATVLTATQGKGYNTWQARYGHSDNTVEVEGVKRNPNVKLTVPKGQLILADVQYKADLVWTLAQTL